MINSRKLEDLHPKVAEMCKKFVEACALQGIDVLITSTYRDAESQNALYNQGRTPESKARGEHIVTNARAGFSWHNFRCAFDFVPIVNGKAQWNDTRTFKRCGLIAESLGLEWAGRWESFTELAHCQYTGGKTLAQLRAGATIV